MRPDGITRVAGSLNSNVIRRKNGAETLKKLLFIASFLILPSLLFAQEQNVFQGEKKTQSLADAFLLDISYGPIVPNVEFKKLSLPPSKFDSAEYRATFARYEIYASLNVDLIGMFEDLGREIVSTYYVPLDPALDFDRGTIEFVEWKSFNTFVIKCTGVTPEFNALIKILPGGKFGINKM